MKSNISILKTEKVINFILWVCAVSYSIYEVYKAANDYFSSNSFEDTYNDFIGGWDLLNRKKDVSDIEWKYVKIVLNSLLPWCILHIIGAEIIRHYNRQILFYWYSTISFAFVLYNFGFKMLIYFCMQPVLGYLASQFKSKLVVWLYYIFSLIVINYYKWVNSEILNLHSYTNYVTTSAIFWINLRSLNYFLEVVTNEELRKLSLKNLITAYAYCLYLPYLFTGPLILFTDFNTVLKNTNSRSISQRCLELIINLIRYISWILITEIALHFIYVNALSYQPQVMNFISSWALYGAGYCMGQFFQMKYVVFYGLSTTLAKFEGIPVPGTPKCIGRIHLYSDMWKHFDRGLYLFLLRYIYIPLSGSRKYITRKLFASFMCFLFVYVWHGIQNFIAIWSLLNFIGVTIESICNEISKTTFYRNKVFKQLGIQMHRRFVCMLAAPLFAMSAISNFYFFAGKEIGDIYVRRFLQGPFYVTFNILTVLYFGSQVSMEIKLWEESREKKKTRK